MAPKVFKSQRLCVWPGDGIKKKTLLPNESSFCRTARESALMRLTRLLQTDGLKGHEQVMLDFLLLLTLAGAVHCLDPFGVN